MRRFPFRRRRRRARFGDHDARDGHNSENTMSRHTILTLAAALLATTVAANAQTAQDHAAHHPDAAAATATNASPHKGCPAGDLAATDKTGSEMMKGNTGAMMGGGMGSMMQMMGGGMAMAPFAHIEGRIAFLKAELAITDAQAPQWSAFADALRERAKVMRDSMTNMMQADKPANAADRTDAMVKMMSAHLESMKTFATAEKALYAVLTDAQKETADELLGGSMMGAGGPMMGADDSRT
jgi:hypothetical protein